MRKRRNAWLLVLAVPVFVMQIDFSGCIPSLGDLTGGGGGSTTSFRTPPTVVLLADRDRIPVGQSIQFDSGPSTDTGLIIARNWDFGDGQSSVDIAPTHRFNTAGTFTVKLTLTNDAGLTATRSRIVRVTVPPVAVITADATSAPSSPAVFNFSAADSTDSDGTIVGYQWEFGDGSTAVVPNVFHTFQTSGSFRVRLTVTDNNGVTNSTSRIIEVGLKTPQIEFRTPPAGVQNIVATSDSPLWVHTVFTVEPNVPYTLKAGLDGDSDPCEAQSVLYSGDTGAELFRLEGHVAPVRALAYSRDGRFLISAGDAAVRQGATVLQSTPRA